MTDRARHARTLFAGIAPEYEWMGAVLSFGQDARWRRTMVSKVNALPGSLVLDVASGTGLVARELAARKRFRVVQLDPSEAMLRAGDPGDGEGRARAAGSPERSARRAARRSRRNVRRGDVHVPAALRRRSRAGDDASSSPRPASGWHARVPGVPRPDERMLHAGWWGYTRLVMPVVGAVVSPAWRYTGRFLGPSISGFYDRSPLPEQVRWWQAAGLRHVRTRVMSLGAGIVFWAVKDGSRVV